MANQVLRAIARVFKVIIHALDMGRHPADAAFKKRELDFFEAVQQTRTKHAGKARHDWENTRQHTVGKMMLKELIDHWKLKAEVNGDG